MTTSYGQRLSDLAKVKPTNATALTFVATDGTERHFTWRDLDERSNMWARRLRRSDVGTGDIVGIQLTNSPDAVCVAFAIWKLGAVPVPIRWDLPAWELTRVRAAVSGSIVVDEDSLTEFDALALESDEALPPLTSPWKFGICSSGSTGTPKVIVQRVPATFLANSAPFWYARDPEPQTTLVSAPFYHNNGFLVLEDLMQEAHVVLMEKFDAAQFIELVAKHEVTGFVVTPTLLQRMTRAPGVKDCDFSRIRWVAIGASPLPPWVARFWFELIDPKLFAICYGSSERSGVIACDGIEWLSHPGTLGRGHAGTEVKILDDHGNEVVRGDVGEIYMRQPGGLTHFYLGDVTPTVLTEDGYSTLGDLGWMDDEEYVYLADRRVDMIVSGGANVYPAEVEAALSESPDIADVVVIGLRDDEWGKRVHAIVEPSAEARGILTSDVVIAYAKSRLAAYKVPKTVEFVSHMPRSEATKVSRVSLTADRETGSPRPTELP